MGAIIDKVYMEIPLASINRIIMLYTKILPEF